MKWLSLAETSELTGLAVATLRNYARSRQSSLVRGSDYTVKRSYRFHHMHRELLFSERGIRRLILLDYRVFHWYNRPVPTSQRRLSRHADGQGNPVLSGLETTRFPEHINIEDLNRAVRQILAHPCADTNCHCVNHLVLPKADVLAAAMKGRNAGKVGRPASRPVPPY